MLIRHYAGLFDVRFLGEMGGFLLKFGVWHLSVMNGAFKIKRLFYQEIFSIFYFWSNFLFFIFFQSFCTFCLILFYSISLLNVPEMFLIVKFFFEIRFSFFQILM